MVTASPVAGMVNIRIVDFGTKEQNELALTQLAYFMKSPTMNTWDSVARTSWVDPRHASGVALIPRGFANALATTTGYSKMDVKTFLFNRSKLPWADALATGMNQEVEGTRGQGAHIAKGKDMPIADNPKQITFVVAGGDQSGHVYWMEVGHGNYTNVSQEITLPKNWDALLTQAEKDLGPAPVTH